MIFKKKSIVPFLKIFITFLFFLLLNIFVNRLTNDEIWNYGFTYNIYKGLIPYKDFNMVLTPLYPFLMSIPFHIFGPDILVFHIENAIILTCMFYIIYKLIGSEVFLIGLYTVFFSVILTFPSYNLLILFLVVLIIYLEKKEANDYLIGFLIACSFLTKQSIGLFLIFPSLYYFKNKKKLFKRAIGFIVPCLLFLLYLIISGSLYQFFDLCLFGLFDFTSNNTHSIINYILFVLYIILAIVLIIKDRKNINYYYALCFSMMMVPLFDLYHSVCAYVIIILVYLIRYDPKKLSFVPLFILGTLGIVFINIYNYNHGFKIIYPNNINHFKYRFIREDSLKFTNDVLTYIGARPNEKYVFANSSAYYFRLITDTKIGYIDLLNNGNYGYHSKDKMIKEIKKYKDYLFLINEDELRDDCQMNNDVIMYIKDHGERIDSVGIFEVYDLKD